jgi:hypothetical protein
MHDLTIAVFFVSGVLRVQTWIVGLQEFERFS